MRTTRLICKDCGDSMSTEYRNKVDLVEELNKVQEKILNGEPSYAKVTFTDNLDEYYNEEIGQYYYYNNLSEALEHLQREHMWIMCGNINFEEKTVCGVLCNDPVSIKNIKEGSIIIIDFDDIEDIKLELE